jgi:hypothetical protein
MSCIQKLNIHPLRLMSLSANTIQSGEESQAHMIWVIFLMKTCLHCLRGPKKAETPGSVLMIPELLMTEVAATHV